MAVTSPRRIEQRARAVRTMARVRWVAVPFALIQVLTFGVPYPPGFRSAALALVALLGLANLAISVSVRAGDERRASRLAFPSLMLDLVVLIGFVCVYTFDPETSIWAILYVAPLEGALLYQRRGAFATMAVGALAYTAREAVGAAYFDNGFFLESITFRMGIGFIVAAVAGATTEGLVAERDRVAQSEERLDAILRNSRDGIVVIDADAVIRYATSAIGGLIGYEPVELLGRRTWEFLHTEDRPLGERKLAWMLEEPDRTASMIGRVRHKDGGLVWLEITATDRRNDPAIGGILLNLHDVTARQLAEAQTKLATNRLRNVLANLPGMAYRCDNDEDWTMHYVSEGVTTLTGYEPEDLLADGSLRYADLIHPDDRERVWAEVQAALDRDEAFQLEYRIITRSGEEKWVWEQGRLVELDAALEGLVIDATQRKRLEAALSEAQKMEAIGRLAGGIAHDFNNILAVVTSYADLLLDEETVKGAVQEDIREIRDAGRRGGSLVRQLLAFSRTDVVQAQPIVVSGIVSEMSNLLRRAVGEAVQIDVQLHSTATVVMDPTQLEQVLLNLVLNARDAMDGAGKVSVTTEDVEVGDPFHIGMDQVQTGRYVSLVVSDTGVGMPAEVAEHIFEPFFTTKSLGGGSGLGLSTVYGIVRASRGHIDVVSEPGLGTRFILYLPVVGDAAVVRSVEAGSASPKSGRCGSILVVEDEDAVRAVVERMLVGRGHRVVAAANGPEALDHVTDIDFDLIVTDVVMPGLSGPAMVSALRERNVSVPVIYMSGYDDGMIAKERGGAHSESVLLKKPFTKQDLLTAVQSALEGPDAPVRQPIV